MATISNTPRPTYVWDSTDNVWYPIGVGSHSHNEISKTIADAKGDLIVGTGADTVDRLAAGNNGDTLLADSTQTTGLRWGNNLGFTAGKNKIINGDFGINQRAFSSSTLADVFTFDRWNKQSGGTEGTVTVSAQTFTPGTAPVSGYESANFIRNVTSGATSSNTYSQIRQFIEDVRTFAGQTVTLSFWAKASSGTPKVALEVRQNFGSGGSPSALVQNYAGQATLSTSWARYSITYAVPSISGKTIGTTANTSYLGIILWLSAGADYNSITGSLGIQNNTIDIWGVQIEAGSVATSFQTATGTIQGELAACQRYYWRSSPGGAYSVPAPSGFVDSSTNVITFTPLPVSMRVAPTSIEWSTLQYFDASNAGATPSAIALNTARTTTTILSTDVTITGGTAGRFAYLRANNSTAAYLAASAEL